MAEREVRIRFTGDAGVLKGQAGELRTLFGNLVNDTNDVRDAGLKWADAYRQQSDRIRADMADVVTSADVLADSLGPEMVAALERSGRSVEDQVQELLKLGLTHDDIRASSDELAAALSDRDDALRRGMGTVGDGFRTVADESGRARDVMNGFIGNAVSEIPGVTEAFGPLGEAAGQLVEGFAGGDIGLKSFLTTAGGLAAATVGVQLVGSAIEALGADQREMNARTDEVVDALEDQIVKSYELATATGVAGGQVDGLAAAQGALSQSLVNAGDDGDKLRLALGQVGLTSQDAAATLVKLKSDPLAALKEVAMQAGATAQEAERLAQKVNEAEEPFWGVSEANSWLTPELIATGKAMEELQDQAEKTNLEDITLNFLNAQSAANDASVAMVQLAESNLGISRNDDPLAVWAEFNRLLGEADAQTRDSVLGTHEYADALRAQEEAQRNASDAARDAAAAEKALLDARLSAIDAGYAARSAQDAYTTALERARDAKDDDTTAVDEWRQAQDAAAKSALDAASAIVRQAEELAAANGEAMSAEESHQLLIDTLARLAEQAGPDSPVRAALLDHIAYLQSVPPEVGTTFTVEVVGDEDAANRIGFVRQQAAGDTTATVTVGVAGTDDALGRIGFVRQSAEDDMSAATDATTDLGDALDELPDKVQVAFELTGYLTFMSQLRAVRDLLHEVENAADRAERAVAQVAD